MKKKYVLMPVVTFMMLFLVNFECYGQSSSNSSVKNCKLTFIARSPTLTVDKKLFSGGGHTYVKLSADITWKASGNKFRYDKVMGFYPNGEKDSAGWRPGKIKYETFHSGKITESFSIDVTSEQYYQIIAVGKIWDNRKYKLLVRDCVTFVAAISNLVKLKTPNRNGIGTPMLFLQTLKRLN